MLFMDLVAGIWSKAVEPKIESHAVKLADVLYSDKRIQENVHAHLLKKYGNEVYYNDLDGYITTHHVIELLIKAIRGESGVQSRIERQFKRMNAKRFIEYNPQYKRNKVVSSRIPGIFGEIYHIVLTSVVSLDPHSDLGKVQQSVEISSETILDGQQVMDAKLDKILEAVQPKPPLLVPDGIADTATENIGKCPEEITRVTEKIKEIEREYQKNHRFQAALSQYYGLLQSVATTLVGHSQEHVNTLVCTLYCNIALCHSNLGFPEKAFESLSAIPEDAASQSKVYHLVYALVYIQQNDLENYNMALNHVDAALKIDPEYQNAFNTRQFLLAHLHPERMMESLHELELRYSDILSKDEDRSNIAEYYQFHGLINMYADLYSDAIADFKLAETYGYDPIYTKMNIAVTMYAEATAAMPRGQRLLAPAVNQKVMMEAIGILKETIDVLKGNVDYDDIRKRAIILYVAACTSIGKKHELSPVDDYIYEGQEYEDKRAILLGAFGRLTPSQLSLLAPEDRLFCTVRDLIDSGNQEACKEHIIGLIIDGSQSISAPVYHALLQVCLITETPADYWKYRDKANDYGISGELLDSMDACAFELDGNISQAKMLYDRIATSSVDANLLENALRFYFRQNLTGETRSLLLRMHELIVSNSMYIANAEPLYREANKFFISQRDPIIEKILWEVPTDLVSSKCRLELFASYYGATFNSGELFKCLNELTCASGEFTNAFTTALCAARLLKYDEALDICYALEARTENNDDKVKLFWLISDILLLMNDFDNSFLWAKKAHELTSTNPYDRSHQAFFTRAFRCNHQEALKDILDYKEEHPVVVDWLHKFSISEDDEDVVTSIQNALEEFAPGHASYMEQEKEVAKLYKQGIVPISMLLKRYNDDLLRLFAFASEHKLILAHGNFKMVMADCKKLGQALVVDALTLVIVAYHGCLSALDGFAQVYINYKSISMIQQLFLREGLTCLSDILTWFQTSSNIIFVPDGFVDEESPISEAFSSDFVACCGIASTYKVPYLYCDAVARDYQRLPWFGIAKDVEFVSIPAVCRKSFEHDQEKLNDALYSLLKDSTFINFNADTILHQIRKQNHDVSMELMAPFMFCTPTCDMHSFASVYLSAIKTLKDECPDAAVILASIVLEDAFKIWKRGTYHRQMIKSVSNAQAEYKTNAISEYVLEILQGLVLIFGVLPMELSKTYEVLSSKIEYLNE